jgi:NAD(P)-dependent dehydrogenase (short-subunit alcohol dehydrogenase family)
MEMGLGFEGTHVVVTGGAGYIGTAVVQAFLAAGAVVSAFDINKEKMELQHERLHWQVADITSESSLEAAFGEAYARNGVISTCIALAGLDLSYLPQCASLCDMPLSQWQRTHRTNAEGTFLTARTWLRNIRSYAAPSTRNVSLVIIGSEAGTFGVTGNADYGASKSAIQYGLVQSLVKDVVNIHPRARVNAVAPGPVDTPQFQKECAEDSNAMWLEAQATVAMKTPVPTASVARTVLFLASENWSGNTTGQVLSVDSGKSGKVHWLPAERGQQHV